MTLLGLLVLMVGVLASRAISADAADPTASITASPNPLTYDDVDVGESKDATITVKSTGTAPLSVAGVSNYGRDAEDFRIVGDGCTGQTVAPGSTCEVVLRFTPSVSTTRVTSVRIRSTNACTYYVTVAGGGDTTSGTAASARACEIVTNTVTTPGATTSTTTPGATVTTPGPTTTSSSAASVSPGSTSTVTTPGSTTSTTGVVGTTTATASKCKSRRTVALHINPKRGVKYSKIVIKRNNKTIKTYKSTSAKKVTYKLVLTGQPKTRNKINITATTTTGKTVKRQQYFVTCVAKTSTR